MATNPNLLPATAMLMYQPADPFEDSATRGTTLALPKSLLQLYSIAGGTALYVPNGSISVPTPNIWKHCFFYWSNGHPSWIGLMLGGADLVADQVIVAMPNYGAQYKIMSFPWLGWTQVSVASGAVSDPGVDAHGNYGYMYLTTRQYRNVNVAG